MKTRRGIFLIGCGLVMAFSSVQAQQEWDLQQCIEHALDNNISIKQQKVNANYYGNQLKQARNNRLPGLSGNVVNNFGFGRNLQYDNSYRNYNYNETSGSLNASMVLLNGLTLRHAIKKADFDLKSSMEDLKKAKNDITLNVTAAYLQILLARELIDVDRSQLGLTSKQIERTKKLVLAGSVAKGNLLEIQSQYAQEEVTLVNDQNSLQLSYLDLYQLLEIPATKEFKIQQPQLPVITSNQSLLSSIEVYQAAVKFRPEVKSQEFKLKSLKEQLAIAKGNLYPSLSLQASYSNVYNNQYENSTGDKLSFFNQIKNNDQYGVGLNLSIPIFGKLQGRTEVKNAELNLIDQKLELQSSKNTLRKEIEQAYTNAVAALKKYMASTKAVESMQEAFHYSEEKFNVGMVNSFEYNEAKNKLIQAKSDLVQSKYDYIFRTKILDFYNGMPIKL